MRAQKGKDNGTKSISCSFRVCFQEVVAIHSDSRDRIELAAEEVAERTEPAVGGVAEVALRRVYGPRGT